MNPNARLSLALLAALGYLGSTASSVWAELPAPSIRLGSCQPSMATADELFPQRQGLKIVVTRFVGQDEPSEKLGADLGYSLSQELPEYIRKSLQKDLLAAGLTGDELQVRYVPCQFSSHRDARSVGDAWGADLMFWGQATSSGGRVLSQVPLPPVVSKGAKVTFLF